jgi:hypothetical protein
VVGENLSHDFRGRVDEVLAALEGMLAAGQAEIGLVNQGGWLERVAAALAGEVMRCHATKLPVGERKEVRRRRRSGPASVWRIGAVFGW